MPAPVIALTVGEPAGIGPEVIAAALRSPLPRGFHYEVVGSTAGARPGHPTRRSARQALAALETAFAGWKDGRYAAVVTGPVQKEALADADAGFTYAGQTEFFADRCGLPADRAVMVLTSLRLTVALLSTHLSLRAALGKITAAKLRYVIAQTADFLRRRGIAKPRIAVAGVNPHAGENGLFGTEEIRLLHPTILAEARRHGDSLDLSGPHSPDTVYWRAARGEFDAVISAYHDQGLIPFKLLSFHDGVNTTLGLPIIRTSPDHGTALDLAGTGKADPRSMIAAIRLAAKLARPPRIR